MAKSIRSKQERKNRAIKREQIYKPVEDARMERVIANLGPVDTVLTNHLSFSQTSTFVGKRRRNRRNTPSALPSAYGLSKKEVCF